MVLQVQLVIVTLLAVTRQAATQSNEENLNSWTDQQRKLRRAYLQAKYQGKDYRRLKKQEGALRLVGGERGPFEGRLLYYLIVCIHFLLLYWRNFLQSRRILRGESVMAKMFLFFRVVAKHRIVACI